MISDIELKTIEKRLDGIKEGVQRLRTILIITIIASSAIFFVLFNSNLSRIHTMALAERDNPVKSEGKTFAEQGKEVLLTDWYKSRNIQVNFLGISVNVTDLPIVGSLTLTVIAIWYFYGYRQTNRAIVGILEEASKYEQAAPGKSKEEIIGLRKMIYTSISQTSVFTKNDTLHPSSAGDENSEGSNERAPRSEPAVAPQGKTPEGLRIIRWVKRRPSRIMNWLDRTLLGNSDRPTWYGEPDNDVESEPATFTDKLVKFMFYLPFWTTLAILIREVYNLLSSSPIKAPSSTKQLSPVDAFWQSRQIVSMFNEQHYWDIFLAFVFSGFALLFAMYLLVLCNACLAFSLASTRSLWKFNEETMQMEDV